MPSRRGKILTQFAFSMFTVDCDSATKLRCKIYITKQQKITLNLDLLKQTWIFPFHLGEFKEFGFLLGLLIRTPYVLNSSVKNRLRGGILVNLSTKKYIFVFFVFRIIMLSLFPDQRGWPFRGPKLLRGPWRFYVLDCNSDQQKCTTPGLPDKLVRLSSFYLRMWFQIKHRCLLSASNSQVDKSPAIQFAKQIDSFIFMPVSAMTSNGKTKPTPEVRLAVLGRAGVGKSGKSAFVFSIKNSSEFFARWHLFLKQVQFYVLKKQREKYKPI